ncbi:MAG: TonB-dependent receptor [Pseudomonadales bacterium]|nr:TonB-dependent receptor [Pseudomonadales bacterium]
MPREISPCSVDKPKGDTIRIVRQLSLVVLFLFASLCVSADEFEFQIPAGQADVALNEYAQITGIRLLFRYDEVSERQTNEVVGNYGADEALRLLLTNTGLVASYSDRGNLVIKIEASVKNQESAKSRQENTMKNQQSIFGRIGTALTGLLLGSGAVAESSVSDSEFMEEIVVTATKRTSRMQDLPISINAFGSDRLQDSAVNSIEDVQYLTAGLKIGDYLGQSVVTIRGIGTQQLVPGFESGAAIHLDGVYLSSRYDTARPYFDVERIEVLRGPQGTLYGRNATGGNINVITKAPSDELEVGAKVTVGNYDLIQTEGYLSGPITDNLLARFAFKSTKRDGFTKNLFNNQKWNDADQASFRGKLEYRASDRVTVGLTVDRNSDDSTHVAHLERFAPDQPTQNELNNPDAFIPTALGATKRLVNHDYDTYQTVETQGASVTVTVDFDNATLTSITGWRDASQKSAFDIDYSNAPAAFFRDWSVDNETLSQEFNLVSTGGGAWNWVIGGFYFTEDASSIVDVRSSTGLDLLLSAPKLDSDAWAVFAEVTYQFSDDLELTIGARYSEEEKEMEESIEITTFGLLAGQDSLKEDYSSFTPKIALTYQLSDRTTMYATVARGFKAGGFNPYFLQGSGFEPEEVTNYEIGMKSIYANGRVRVNWSLFSMDYEDLQVFQIVQLASAFGTSSNIVTNAGDSDIDGIELEIRAEPVDNLHIDFNASYLDATYGELFLPTIDATSTVNVEGNHLVAAPKISYNIGIARTWNIGDWGTGSIRVEYSWQDKVYFRPHNEERISMDDYGLVNLRISFRDASERWNYTFFGENLSDELIVAHQNLTTGDNFPIQNAFMAPRTYGLAVSVNF